MYFQVVLYSSFVPLYFLLYVALIARSYLFLRSKPYASYRMANTLLMFTVRDVGWMGGFHGDRERVEKEKSRCYRCPFIVCKTFPCTLASDNLQIGSKGGVDTLKTSFLLPPTWRLGCKTKPMPCAYYARFPLLLQQFRQNFTTFLFVSVSQVRCLMLPAAREQVNRLNAGGGQRPNGWCLRQLDENARSLPSPPHPHIPIRLVYNISADIAGYD